MTKLRQRLGSEQGFTLIELLVVIVIIGILLAIAVPSYLGFRDRANERAAESNVREAIPSAEAYYADRNNYTGISAAVLRSSYDSGLSSSVTASSATASTYCISAVQGDYRARVNGPGGTITSGKIGEAGTPASC